MTSSVVYDHWRGEEWASDGRYCRHLPTDCVFLVRGESAELIEGDAPPELFELARGYYRVFGCQNRYPEERSFLDVMRDVSS
jgi:hypothetical protein